MCVCIFVCLCICIHVYSRPGQSQGLLFTHYCNWFIDLVILFLPLRRHQAQRFWDGATSHKIDYVAQAWGILNLKGYQNCIIGSKVMAILLNGQLLPICWVALQRVCSQPEKLCICIIVCLYICVRRLTGPAGSRVGTWNMWHIFTICLMCVI